MWLIKKCKKKKKFGLFSIHDESDWVNAELIKGDLYIDNKLMHKNVTYLEMYNMITKNTYGKHCGQKPHGVKE